MEGMRRLDEWQRIIKVLPSDDAQLHALGPAPNLPVLEEIAAHANPPTLGELLVERGDERFAVCEQLLRAFERGLLAVNRDRAAPDATRGSRHDQRHPPGQGRRDARSRRASTTRRRRCCARRSTSIPRAPTRAPCWVGCRASQLVELYSILPRDHIPVFARAPAAGTAAAAARAALLEQINGRWDVGALSLTTGLGNLETLRALKRLLHAGVVRLVPPRRRRCCPVSPS